MRFLPHGRSGRGPRARRLTGCCASLKSAVTHAVKLVELENSQKQCKQKRKNGTEICNERVWPNLPTVPVCLAKDDNAPYTLTNYKRYNHTFSHYPLFRPQTCERFCEYLDATGSLRPMSSTENALCTLPTTDFLFTPNRKGMEVFRKMGGAVMRRC